jgi:aspartyl-tRNA(Asn)/glutamyl-tRNA(Gln) amidotransferase subunit B
VFALMFETGADPAAIVEQKGLRQISDATAIERIAAEIIAANPDHVAKLKDNPKVFGWFVGQLMKATQGQANPQLVNEVLRKKLEG